MQRLLLTTMALCLLAACGRTPTGPARATLDDLTGRWILASWGYSDVATPTRTVDWVETRGLSGTLEIRSDGSFSVDPALPGGGGRDHGTLAVRGDSLHWDGQNDEEWLGLVFVDTRRFEDQAVILSWPEEEVVDMDLDGTPERVRLVVRYRRNTVVWWPG
jgi:hypothetical protein